MGQAAQLRDAQSGWEKMNAKDAGIVGKRLANAALILATGVAIASIIAAIGVVLG
ncbi:hypothetical protein CRPA15_23420 [Pseudomonas aeruginosa]